MRVVFIGSGSGHIGSYLLPRLVEAGHEVINVCRTAREPYVKSSATEKVKTIIADREVKGEAPFAKEIVALAPDIVIDNICYEAQAADILSDALNGKIRHLIVTGTIWVHGYSQFPPTRESDARFPIDDYGRKKNEIEELLLKKQVLGMRHFSQRICLRSL